MSRLDDLRSLHRRSLPSLRIVGLAVASTTVGGLAQLLLMASLGYLLAWSAARPALGAIAGVLTVVELLAFFRAPLRYLDRLRSHAVAFAAMRFWRLWLFDRLIPLSPGGLGATKSGEVLATAMSDVDGLGDLYIRVLVPLLGTVVPFVVGIGLVASASGIAAATCTALCALGLFAIWRESRRGARLATDIATAQGQRTGILHDALRGATTLTSAGGWGRPLAEAASLEQHLGSLSRRLEASVLRRTIIAQALSATMVIGALGSVITGPRVGDARLSIALVTMALALGELTGGAALALASIDTVLASWTRLCALSEREPLMSCGETPLPPSALGIVADNISLTFANSQALTLDRVHHAFRDVSFTVEPGQRVVITGPSGSGKTSVLICLLGLWPRDAGTISLSGIDFDALFHDDLRAQVGTHLSTSALFSGTVRSNLEGTGASEDAMRAALSAVGLPAEEFLDRRLFEQGRGLSGGEHQRISVVRALLGGRVAVFLDEPTAQLDDHSAALVLETITKLTEGKTVVMVAHERGDVFVDDEVHLSSRR